MTRASAKQPKRSPKPSAGRDVARRDPVPASPCRNQYYCIDAVEGAKRLLPDGAVDLIISDPPYGIEGDKLHKHYNRKEEFVVDGYVEVPAEEYPRFSDAWIAEAARVLRPGGAIFLVSGYSQLASVLNALAKTDLREVNHIVWKYNFGVSTNRKFVSSHYHILYYEKPGGRRTFNCHARFGTRAKTEKGGSALYADLEDVWVINREYQPGRIKNKNQLPTALLVKMIQYASNPGDLVFDFFLGSFSTARVAKALDRDSGGFELNPKAHEVGVKTIAEVERGSMLASVPTGAYDLPARSGEPMTDAEEAQILAAVDRGIARGLTKRKAVDLAMEKFDRGYWAIEKVLKRRRQQRDSESLFEPRALP